MDFVGPTSWSTGTKSAVQESSHLLTYIHADLVTYKHTDPVTYILTDILQESSNLSDLEKYFIPVEMSQMTNLEFKKLCLPVQESSDLLTYIHPDLVTYKDIDPVTYKLTDLLQESSNLSDLEKPSVPVETS